LVCSRPAVSTTTVSTSPSVPVRTASKATDAGSPPSRPRTVRTPTRSPQVSSWSAAAARNVSAAPRTTLFPSPTSTRAVEVGAEDGDQLADQQLAQIGARRRGQHHRLGAQPLDDLGGGRDADIGGEEGLLDLFPVVLGELLAGQDGEQAAAERGLRARQP
jgi:hypothetical protein